MFAREETVKLAIETVRKQSFGPVPRRSGSYGKSFYKTRGEWVESCAILLNILNDVLADVQNRDKDSLLARNRNMVDFYQKKEIATALPD